MGTVCQRTGRRDEAVSLYRRAIKANPTLWVAFEALANMGIVSNPDTVLPLQTDVAALERLRAQPLVSSSPPLREPATPVAINPLRDTSVKRHQQNGIKAALAVNGPGEMDAFATPSPMPTRLAGQPFGEMVTPLAPQPRPRHVGRRMPRRSASPMTANRIHHSARRTRATSLADSSIRNPADLFASTPDKSAPDSTLVSGRPRSHALSDLKPSEAVSFATVDAENDRSEKAGAGETSATMDLLRSLGQLVSELGRYRCTKVIELASKLPSKHRNSAFVLSLRGRAYLEKGDYSAAEQEFKRALFVDPVGMDGVVEYYSTVLWHLKKEKELAHLALTAQRVFPVSASAWCAAGNCFSLQNDPDAALKMFRRAIVASRSPNAYTYTLCGHEYVAKEDFDAALSAYREALHIDERHYNAMYGIGQVLQKQEKYGLAQNHFRSAVLINPLNSTLHYHLGVSLASWVTAPANNDQYQRSQHRSTLVSALAELETAANLDNRNPVPRFERAKILVAMHRLNDARRQLEELRDLLPKEAEVHYELSRVCQSMGDKKTALHALTMALDIEPKERKYKKALDAISTELQNITGRAG